MIIEDVFKIKRGTVIAVKEAFFAPAIGEEYSCGVDSWKIIGVEKIKGCFGISSWENTYLLLISPVNDSEDPYRGYVLDKIIK